MAKFIDDKRALLELIPLDARVIKLASPNLKKDFEIKVLLKLFEYAELLSSNEKVDKEELFMAKKAFFDKYMEIAESYYIFPNYVDEEDNKKSR